MLGLECRNIHWSLDLERLTEAALPVLGFLVSAFDGLDLTEPRGTLTINTSNSLDILLMCEKAVHAIDLHRIRSSQYISKWT